MEGKAKWVIPGFQGIAFGLMDGLITMLGIIIGIARATSDVNLVILASVVGGVANSFANSIGFCASELAERGQQIQDKKKGKETHIHTHNEIIVASVMAFIACILALIVPITPFFYFSLLNAMYTSFTLSVILLFLLGYEVGRISEEENRFSIGIKYAIAGIFGAIICYFVGDVLQQWIQPTII